MSKDKQPNVPFKNFFPNISFVASVLTGVATSAAISLAGQQSFLGRSDEDTLRKVYRSAVYFTWSACATGVALILALLMQLLFTSPHFEEFTLVHKRESRWVVGVVGWLSLAFAASGTALIGEGLKMIDRQAGAMLEWMLLGCGLPVVVIWLVVRIPRKCE